MPKYNENSLNSVPVGPLAEAVQRSGIPYAEIALRCGWTRNERGKKRGGDATRLRRRLGIAEYTTRGKKHRQQFISYENAAIIAEAINVDPFEVGI